MPHVIPARIFRVACTLHPPGSARYSPRRKVHPPEPIRQTADGRVLDIAPRGPRKPDPIQALGRSGLRFEDRLLERFEVWVSEGWDEVSVMFCVVANVECPRRLETTSGETPARNSSAAWVVEAHRRDRRNAGLLDQSPERVRQRLGVQLTTAPLLELRRDLGGVLALGSLLGHAEHRSDLRPGTIGVAGITNRTEQRGVDLVSLLHQLGDGAQRCGVGLDEIVGVDVVGPLLEGLGPLCTCRRHGVHQPLKNLDRAGSEADDRDAIGIIDDTFIQRITSRGRSR